MGGGPSLRVLAGVSVALAIGLSAPPALAALPGNLPGNPDFGGFRNVLSGGQGETVDAGELAAFQADGTRPKSFIDQVPLYRDILYSAPRLSSADVQKFFKAAGFTPPSGAALTRTETVASRPGLTILRDEYEVPHVYGKTRPDVMFGAGYVSAQDRLFFMDVLRHTGRARLSELAGPGNLGMDAEQLKVADYSEAELQQMIDAGAQAAGAEGQQIKTDLENYTAGINQYIAEARAAPLTKLPAEYPALGKTPADWKLTDTAAIASLIGGIFGKGGGAEARAAEALDAAQRRFGATRGRAVFEDFRREDDPEAPVTTHKRFPFDDPGAVDGSAVARVDAGSLEDRNPIVSDTGASSARSSGPAWLRRLQAGIKFPSSMSNALLVARRRTASGRPVAVMGPQVGYYSPQILMEIDLHGGGVDARGATFPGISLFVLLGHGRDFAWSATTATTDNVDEFAERLCEPGGGRPTKASDHYLYKGKCIPFLERDHVLTIAPPPVDPSPPRQVVMKVERSVHGPIQGRATVRGQPVAIAEARSTYFHELESARFFKRLNDNQVKDPATFHRAASVMNFAFNWFYADDRHIAYVNSGWYPRRARGTDPSLPAWGTGQWDWQGFKAPPTFTSLRVPFSRQPKDIDPTQGYIVNWNNKQAPGWRSADDQWSYSADHRSNILEKPLRTAVRRGRVTRADVAKVMELGATVDLRGRESLPWIQRVIGNTGSPRVNQLLGILRSWQVRGSFRWDLDKDGTIDRSAAVALMDAWWPPLVRGAFEPTLGRTLVEEIRDVLGFGHPPGTQGSEFGSGWWGQLTKDLRAILGRRVRDGLSRRYCGGGSRSRCRAVLIETLRAADAEVSKRFGSADPSKWKVDVDEIEQITAGAVDTPPIPWQNRPTFQQVVEVAGHRPR